MTHTDPWPIDRTHTAPSVPPPAPKRYAAIQTLIEHPQGLGLYGSDSLWRDANYAVCQSLNGWYRVPDADVSYVLGLFGETRGLSYGEYVDRAAAA
jgi:hypothetical protein